MSLEGNLRDLKIKILDVMSKSRLKTYFALELAIQTGSNIDEIKQALRDLVKKDLVMDYGSGYYAITYKGIRFNREIKEEKLL